MVLLLNNGSCKLCFVMQPLQDRYVLRSTVASATVVCGQGPCLSWGRILGRNTDQSSKSFPPCYSLTPLQLCLEISISSNSRNLFQFLVFSYCTVYSVREKGGKPDRKPYPLPYDLRNPNRNLNSENSQVYAQKSQRNWTLMNSASGKITAYHYLNN